jgi:DNA polymerase-3 subunit epsilon
MNNDAHIQDSTAIQYSPESRAALELLTSKGFRFTRPLVERDVYNEKLPSTNPLIAIVLDTETTGTDRVQDQIIELGMVAFEYCPETGLIGRVIGTFNQLEDPGRPIPPESTKIHHITDEMVKGHRIDDEEVESFIENASLIIAHNAKFDRGFVEQRFSCFVQKPLACSFAQIPWSEEGMGSSKLEFLAYRSGFHYEGHRASTDCHALLEVLHLAKLESGDNPLRLMLENARINEFQLSAINSPFDSKDSLKARRYRWNADRKVWGASISKSNLEAEISWLREHVYNERPFKIQLEKIDSYNRFSNRAGAIEIIEC